MSVGILLHLLLKLSGLNVEFMQLLFLFSIWIQIFICTHNLIVHKIL
jgi:hypothetical protein